MKPWNKSRTNSLLLKDDVGMAKQTIYNLPPANFQFGKPIVHDTEGAQQGFIGFYLDVSPEKLRDVSRQGFQATKQDVSTDARVPIKRGSNNINISLPDENFAYGKANQPSSPMKMILSGAYMNEAERIMDMKYEFISKAQVKTRPQTSTKHTRASRGAYQFTNTKIAEFSKKENLFKLKEFDNVKPRTQTRFC